MCESSLCSEMTIAILGLVGGISRTLGAAHAGPLRRLGHSAAYAMACGSP